MSKYFSFLRKKRGPLHEEELSAGGHGKHKRKEAKKSSSTTSSPTLKGVEGENRFSVHSLDDFSDPKDDPFCSDNDSALDVVSFAEVAYEGDADKKSEEVEGESLTTGRVTSSSSSTRSSSIEGETGTAAVEEDEGHVVDGNDDNDDDDDLIDDCMEEAFNDLEEDGGEDLKDEKMSKEKATDLSGNEDLQTVNLDPSEYSTDAVEALPCESSADAVEPTIPKSSPISEPTTEVADEHVADDNFVTIVPVNFGADQINSLNKLHPEKPEKTDTTLASTVVEEDCPSTPSKEEKYSAVKSEDIDVAPADATIVSKDSSVDSGIEPEVLTTVEPDNSVKGSEDLHIEPKEASEGSADNSQHSDAAPEDLINPDDSILVHKDVNDVPENLNGEIEDSAVEIGESCTVIEREVIECVKKDADESCNLNENVANESVKEDATGDDVSLDVDEIAAEALAVGELSSESYTPIDEESPIEEKCANGDTTTPILEDQSQDIVPTKICSSSDEQLEDDKSATKQETLQHEKADDKSLDVISNENENLNSEIVEEEGSKLSNSEYQDPETKLEVSSVSKEIDVQEKNESVEVESSSLSQPIDDNPTTGIIEGAVPILSESKNSSNASSPRKQRYSTDPSDLEEDEFDSAKEDFTDDENLNTAHSAISTADPDVDENVDSAEEVLEIEDQDNCFDSVEATEGDELHMKDNDSVDESVKSGVMTDCVDKVIDEPSKTNPEDAAKEPEIKELTSAEPPCIKEGGSNDNSLNNFPETNTHSNIQEDHVTSNVVEPNLEESSKRDEPSLSNTVSPQVSSSEVKPSDKEKDVSESLPSQEIAEPVLTMLPAVDDKTKVICNQITPLENTGKSDTAQKSRTEGESSQPSANIEHSSCEPQSDASRKSPYKRKNSNSNIKLLSSISVIETGNVSETVSRRTHSTSEDNYLIAIVNSERLKAEARLAQRRAARAEARELRLRELERQQQDTENNEEEEQYTATTVTPNTNSYSPPETPVRAPSTPRTRSSIPTSTVSRRSSEDSTNEDGLPASARELKADLKELEEKFRKAMITNAQLDNEKATLTFEVEFLKDKFSELEENHIQLTKEHRKKCSENETLRKLSNKLREEVTTIRRVLQERDELIQEYGLVLIGEENGDDTFEDLDDPERRDDTVNDLSPRRLAVKKALLSHEASELLAKGAAKGSLDVRLRKYAEDKNDLEDEVRRLKMELEEELSRRRKENGLDYEKQKEASKSLNEYKFRVQKAEAEVSTLQANVARLESLVARYKASAEQLEQSEEELKLEKRRLGRELRDLKEKCDELESSKAHVKRQYEKLLHDRGRLYVTDPSSHLKEAQNRLEELELTTSHLQKRFDKLKTARSTLLKDLSQDPA